MLTPSEAKMINWSRPVIFRCVTYGTEISPKSFKQKSPKALETANPGVLSFGLQTLYNPGSSGKQYTLPFDCFIRSASSVTNINNTI